MNRAEWRDRLYCRTACRPILGLLIRGRAVPIPVRHAYLLRDLRTGAYVADPYGDGDRLRRYTRHRERAYRFVRRELAAGAGDDLGGRYVIETVVLEPP